MVYLDNASTTYPKPISVYDGLNDFLRNNCVNAGRGQYKMSFNIENMVEQTRNKLNSFFNTTRHKVVFTSSATFAINTILQGIDFNNIKNVYITHFEHNAVLRTLYSLQKQYNFNIIMLKIKNTDNTICYDLDKMKEQFKSNKPDIVLVDHVSNVCGLIAPIHEIFKLAKEYGSLTFCDGSQSAGLIDIDAIKDNIDFLVFAGHKTLYSIFGIAGFLINNHLNLHPLIYGGNGINSKDKDMPNLTPYKFEAGSLNTYAIYGLNLSLDWINGIGINDIYLKEKVLTKQLKNILKSFKNIKIVGDNDGVGIVSCVFNSYAPDEVGYILDKHNICVRSGLHCAPLAHEYLATSPAGTVRFSLSYFNNENELEKLNEVLKIIERG